MLIDKKYQNYKSLFKQEFVNHFPKNLYNVNNIGKTIYNTTPGMDYVSFYIEVEYANDLIDSLVYTARESSMAVYESNDPKLLIINKFINHDNYGIKMRISSKERELLEELSSYKKLPVPNFWKFNTQNKHSEYLTSDYKLYVLEAKSGMYWDENYLSDKDMMPRSWKHGYSKGVAISSKKRKAIFWFLIW